MTSSTSFNVYSFFSICQTDTLNFFGSARPTCRAPLVGLRVRSIPFGPGLAVEASIAWRAAEKNL